MWAECINRNIYPFGIGGVTVHELFRHQYNGPEMLHIPRVPEETVGSAKPAWHQWGRGDNLVVL